MSIPPFGSPPYRASIAKTPGLQGALNIASLKNRAKACVLSPTAVDPYAIDITHNQIFSAQEHWACDDISEISLGYFNGYYDTSTVDHSYQGTGGTSVLPAFISSSLRSPEKVTTVYTPYENTFLSSHWCHFAPGYFNSTDANPSFTVNGPIFGIITDPSPGAMQFITSVSYLNPALVIASPFQTLLWTSGVNKGFTTLVSAVANSSGSAQISISTAYGLNMAPATGDTFTLYTGFRVETNWNAYSPPLSLAASAITGGSLTSGQAYYYFISTLGPAGESVASASATATPSGISLSVSLTWKLPPNISPAPNTTTFTGYPIAKDFQYKIYRALTNSATAATLLTTINPSNVTSFVDTGAIVTPSATATMTIATPAVFTQTAHGYVANQAIYLTTTGALPTGFAVNTTYYVVGASITTNTFELAGSVAFANSNNPIASTGSQSGTMTVWASAFLTPIVTSAGNGIPISFNTNTNNGEGNVFNSGQDLTLRGAAQISNNVSGGGCGPRIVTGFSGLRKPPTFNLIGDSIFQAVGDISLANYIGPKGYPARALALLGYPCTNSSQGSNQIVPYIAAGNITFRRSLYANHHYNIIELCRNDLLSYGVSAQTVANAVMTVAKWVFEAGSRALITTCMMSTSSTDNWLTYTGQTVLNNTNETQRIAYNTWVRAGYPVDPVNLQYVTPNTSGSIPCPYIFGALDVVAPLEYGLISGSTYGLKQNGGLWRAQVTPSFTLSPSGASSNGTISFTGTPFTAQGLVGLSCLVLSGTGSGTFAQINLNTTNTLTTSGALTVDATSSIQIYQLACNNDGVHPSAFYGHLTDAIYLAPIIQQLCPAY